MANETGTDLVAVEDHGGQLPATYELPSHQSESEVIEATYAGQPVRVSVASEDHQRAAFQVMSRWNGWNDAPGTDSLKEKWGPDTGRNLGYVLAFGQANQDVIAVLEAAGIEDHPAIVEAAAILGRRMAHAGRSTAPHQRNQRMTANDLDKVAPGTAPRSEIDTRLAEVRGQMKDAQAQGRSKEANQLYQQELSLLAIRNGNAPVVGGRGRNV